MNIYSHHPSDEHMTDPATECIIMVAVSP